MSSNNKVNNVEFTNSNNLGNNANRLGNMQRISDKYIYPFQVPVQSETPEIINWLEYTDLTKYDLYIKNPKVGKNTKIVWFEQLKPIVEKLNSNDD
ncbi:MAG: hypothetical protein H8D97_01260 [Proteobacteria bacterium]|nr:hypothetical protein [Pseudomonadota bacterium]